MNPQKLDDYKKRFSENSKPQTSEDWEEYNRLYPIIESIKEYENLHKELKQAQDLLSKESDQDLKNLAELEITDLESKIQTHEKTLEQLIHKDQHRPDPKEKNNAIMEIRPGAGGDEASLFAQDLFRMYSQYSLSQDYKIEIMERNLTEGGGIKELVCKIVGEGAYGKFRYESGVHRVQRVPTTESSGRIHTSTATVAVLPEIKEVDIDIKPQDIIFDTFKASGPGGQFVNKTESGARITHKPSGLVIASQHGRSQAQNREIAMQLLRSKLYEMKENEQHEERAKQRRDQIGSAMRSEKIRTYNYPQSRITDHRLKKSWHDLELILDGNLDKIIESFKDYTEYED